MPTLLLSEAIASRYRRDIATLTGAAWRIAVAAPDLSDAQLEDVRIAFLSSDVLGGSTRDVHEPSMQIFCDLLLRAPGLAWLQVPSAGVDRPVYQALAGRGVAITTAAGAASETVALSALTGLLALSRRLPLWVEAKRTRTWLNLRSGPGEPRELRGEKVLIVGCGRIGSHLARLCQALGMRTHGLRRSPAAAAAPFDAMGTLDELGDAVATADWVVAACPLTPQTRGLFSDAVLRRFAPHASFINIARGGVVDEAALIDALRSGRMEAAYLDVFEVEPLPAASPLWELPNVLLSPHSAGDTRGRHARIAEIFLANLKRWLHGQALDNLVSLDAQH
ncbi:D-2-hydroxyacid dehydrogenase [Bordetella hinzii]|uniref:D-2-hydroxyacid dehydrogenase n=1 Tax=Bordetella hinzii TaxID=103855 RepID=UPI00045B9230|nr:D-2-hydroxyacid dehydrogenase [Bordetella hinzii]AKQ55433.1 Glyoxylate/hydroxypyruvate reductase B [Bordetella hinzii]KCB23056.1 4-phosphoerythronate dehydrogenase [Bordetella hinzii L60]KCB51402.1 4-phosphoerythronate dehydrogenase [Bordetella hinzii 1277]QDJ34488.1 D-2-hydroxyacid dehydrogenase [Bordetella hinzii]QDJ39077.1 D-2-hydroxyacid dehydrogenase [Bordetella hinzii]